MAPVRIRPATEVRKAAEAAFDRQRTRLEVLVPGAEIEHVGSTVVPGALTKGDVDVLVRVRAEDFEAAVDRLRETYAIHQPHNWTSTLASFVDRAAVSPPVGIQLVVAGSREDRFFAPFRDALIADRALLEEYNSLKRRHDGSDYRTYTEEKGKFIARALHRLDKHRGAGAEDCH